MDKRQPSRNAELGLFDLALFIAATTWPKSKGALTAAHFHDLDLRLRKR